MIKILHKSELSNLEVNPKGVWYALGYSDPVQARPAGKIVSSYCSTLNLNR